jgi:hypothetical protein
MCDLLSLFAQCDIDGSKALHARAASQDKSLHLMDGMWHVLTKEPGNDKV